MTTGAVCLTCEVVIPIHKSSIPVFLVMNDLKTEGSVVGTGNLCLTTSYCN